MTHPADDAAEEYYQKIIHQHNRPLPPLQSTFQAGWDACAADPLHAAAPELLRALEAVTTRMETEHRAGKLIDLNSGLRKAATDRARLAIAAARPAKSA